MTFTEKIYALTKKIPAGKVATYGQLAQAAGKPKAARAVGQCLRHNTRPAAVPCHRVVAAGGKLTGYAFGGTSEKEKLLRSEGVIFKGSLVDLAVSIHRLI